MKKIFTIWVFICFTAAAYAANMQFVTVLSQPVGSFSRLSTTSTAPVYANKVVIGSTVKFALKGNARINAAKASGKVEIQTGTYKLGTLNLYGGTLDAKNTAVTVNNWNGTGSVNIKSNDGTLEVGGTMQTAKAGFGTLVLNGTTFFNGTLASNPTEFGFSPDHAPSGSVLLQK